MNKPLTELKLLLEMLRFDTLEKNEGTLLIKKEDVYLGKAFYSSFDEAVILSLRDWSDEAEDLYKKLGKFFKLPKEFDLDVLLKERYDKDI